jgi:hypothetical protein
MKTDIQTRGATEEAFAAAHEIFGETLPADVTNVIYAHPASNRAQLAEVFRLIADAGRIKGMAHAIAVTVMDERMSRPRSTINTSGIGPDDEYPQDLAHSGT